MFRRFSYLIQLGVHLKPRLRVLHHNREAQIHLDIPGMLSFYLDRRLVRSTVRLQLYWGCRWCPLFAIIFEFIGFDVSSKIDCQVWNSLGRYPV